VRTPATVADFTSSLYLGLAHPSSSVAPWRRLTTGAPAALVEPEAAPELGERLAALVGGERATLMPSTLHLFMDLLVNGLPGAALFWDAALYPVAAWGIQLAGARGVPTTRMPHLAEDVDEAWLARRTPAGRRPVVVTDGFCTGCGQPAPLGRLVAAVERRGGLVVIDDTQALGLFGAAPSAAAPFGVGGGGSLRRHGLAGAPIVVGASLAKSLGVPMATAVGPARLIEGLEARSEMRVHTSPPSTPILHAAQAALARAARDGDELRRRLAHHIAVFRRGVSALGLRAEGGLFPAQSLRPTDGDDARDDEATFSSSRALARLGVRAVVTRAACRRRPALTFLIRADHRRAELARALRALDLTFRPRATASLLGTPNLSLSTGGYL
jgi:8-amino-7-oxononanoate synthase